jgi:hypothetical protein
VRPRGFVDLARIWLSLLYHASMATKEDEARVARIRAVIQALTAAGSNNPGVKQENIPSALLAFFIDELREQVAEVVHLVKTQEP